MNSMIPDHRFHVPWRHPASFPEIFYHPWQRRGELENAIRLLQFAFIFGFKCTVPVASPRQNNWVHDIPRTNFPQ
jgi:hypothetical protein